jgi:hypothetical protein
MAKGMVNWLSKVRGLIGETLTGACKLGGAWVIQKEKIFNYQYKQHYIVNNTGKHNSDSLRRPG